MPGLDAVWAFREDLAGTLIGGNKLRKLEGLLGAALVEGAEVLSLGPRAATSSRRSQRTARGWA